MNLVKIIALNQQENARDMKALLAGNSSVLKEVANVVKRIASNQANVKVNVPQSCEFPTLEPSKQALVSALVSEFVVSQYLTRQCPTLLHFNRDFFYRISAFIHKCDARY